MKVINNLSVEISGTNSHYFKLNDLNEDSTTDVLLFGYNHLKNHSVFNSIKDYKRKVYLNITMPTEYCGNIDTLQDSHFDEIYSICPYSVSWLNEITNTNNYKFIYYPFNNEDIPESYEKIYDVCYHGGLHSDIHVECLSIMQNFNYRYMSLTHGINALTRNNLKYATNTDLSNEEKIKTISQSKISICYNFFPVRDKNDINNIKKRDRWEKNEAFKHIDDLGIIPQFKSRFNEAAMSKTLNLIQKDPWNIVEEFYTPNVDFIYFESNDELEDKIKEILEHWEDYIPIVENAYNKSLNYTTQKLYSKIKNRCI